MNYITEAFSRTFQKLSGTFQSFSQLKDEALFERGELSPYYDYRDARINAHVPDHTLITALSFGNGYLFNTNRELCLPSFLAGLEGDEREQQFYEKHRLLHFDSLPSWAQEHTLEPLRQHYNQLRSHVPYIRWRDSDGEEFKAQVPASYEFNANVFFMNTVISYEGANAFQSKIESMEFDDDAPLLVNPDSTLNATFAPNMNGLFGKYARAASPIAYQNMFQALLFSDYMHANRFTLGDTNCRKIVSTINDPWQMEENRYIAAINMVLEALSEQKLQCSTQEKRTILEQVIFDSDPAYILPDAIKRTLRKRAKSQKSPAPKAPSTDQQGSKAAHHNRFSETYRKAFIAGLKKHLTNAFPNFKEGGAVARKLYAIHKKGGASYAEACEYISMSDDPWYALEHIYVQTLRTEALGTQASAEGTSSADADLNPIEDELQDPDEAYETFNVTQLSVNDDKPFQKWLSAQLEDIQDRVHSRMVRIECGNLGDYKPLTTVKVPGIKAFEARMNELRLYFIRPDQNTVTLVWGGDKSTQKSDITRVANILKSYAETLS